jgi:hypothetical protein
MTITYDMIANNTLSTATNTFNFNSIAATYTDLVLIATYDCSTASALQLRFNGDTGSYYSDTDIYTSGSTAEISNSSNQTRMYCGDTRSGYTNSSIINIFNYANTTTYKSVSVKSGNNSYLEFMANSWFNPTIQAINSITVFLATGNFTSGSKFTLYGIKAE